MSRLLATVLVAAASIATATPALAQCTKDTDCKGDRLCELGRCTSPGAAAPQPPPPQPPPPQAPPPQVPVPATDPALQIALAEPPLLRPAPAAVAMERSRVIGGYGTVAAIFDLAGSGTKGGYDAWRPGILVAGHRAFSNRFHLGGYFAFTQIAREVSYGDEVYIFATRSYGAGVSLKVGGWIGGRAWLGFLLEQGLRVFTASRSDDGAYGTEVSPRLHLDALLARASVKLGLSASLGPRVVYNDREGVAVYAGLSVGLFLGH